MPHPHLPCVCDKLITLAQYRLADTKNPPSNPVEINQAVERLTAAGTPSNISCFAKFNLQYVLARSNEISHATINLIERLIGMHAHPDC